ncbi:MAG: Na/Pi cotransporter family protein [Lachnospiraceae bacterium]|nr:Na/Pi cotransporter family protein [Lachnospiraceae bacterium]
MSVFDIITLLGGLAMFLYGMRLMGDSLKEGSSGTLKKVMTKVTNNPIKAFLLGLAVTAIIQSSTATIVITSGLVAAGILTLHQSLGIIIGANLGTTVTGQIIRLLDLNTDGASVLKFFQPSTLAPLALVIGMILIMGFKFKKSNNIGNILIGFGILFSGLLNMTAAVSKLQESGLIDHLFESMGDNMLLGYLVGAAVAFMLQSSSATVGILQAFAMGGFIPFKTVYVMLCGIYLGDCVTTAIVCYIGAKTDAKRVGIINIIYNLAKTILVLVVVTLLHTFGLFGDFWNAPMTSGTIANTNSVFNLACGILLLPVVGIFEKLGKKLVKEKAKVEAGKYAEILNALSPAFLNTPALAFNSCYNVLKTMFSMASENIHKAVNLVVDYDEKTFELIEKDEEDIDHLTDRLEDYLVQIAPTIKQEEHIQIMDEYHKLTTEFERLADHAMNVAEISKVMDQSGYKFSQSAIQEYELTCELLYKILDCTRQAFEKRDAEAARHIEPMEDVMDDMINTIHDNHLERLRDGVCSVSSGMAFLDILSNLERMSDSCSNVGIAVVARVNPELANLAHSYITSLHASKDNNNFDEEYNAIHDDYFARLNSL